MSKIQFESDSQPANHNGNPNLAVGNMSKIQFESDSQLAALPKGGAACCWQYVKDTIWKRFTTRSKLRKNINKLLAICQRYNLKAIHNCCRMQPQPSVLLAICQRYNLKAIHNSLAKQRYHHAAVGNMSKIQFESDSQHVYLKDGDERGCWQYVKDTIWKRFTTVFYGYQYLAALLAICQRYNLKAIHN